MVWFYPRGPQECWICETRLPDVDQYELCISDATGDRVERFNNPSSLLARELELLATWRALGWKPFVGRRTNRPW